MLRVRSITWKEPETPERWLYMIEVRQHLRASGANVDKCRQWFDWWEVEWPK